MRKKNKEIDYRVEKYNELCDAIQEAKDRLFNAVSKAIVKTEVVNIYPEGPDKNRAIKDSEQAKHYLLCAIESYNGRMQEAQEYYANNEEVLENHLYHDRFLPSHELIECIYQRVKNFY